MLFLLHLLLLYLKVVYVYVCVHMDRCKWIHVCVSPYVYMPSIFPVCLCDQYRMQSEAWWVSQPPFLWVHTLCGRDMVCMDEGVFFKNLVLQIP